MKLDPSASLACLYGVKLRKLRLRVGWTQRQLASRVHTTHSRIAQYELGNEVPTEDVSKLLDEALDADGDLHDLWEHVEKGPVNNWRKPFPTERLRDYQAKSTVMRQYLAHCIPGLLQTEAYARELFLVGQPWCTADEIEQQVTYRMNRQTILTRPDPPLLWVVLDEAVVRRAVGTPMVMREQLERLIEAAKAPNIEVQILPFAAGGHPAMGGSMTLMSFEHGPDVVYLEGGSFGKLVTDKASVVRHCHKYGLLQAAALAPQESIPFLEQVVEELSACKP
ncbi:helix-turn-helix domain-containing protein [Streptomyces orinoci]|uniref:Helix-turn-helix transcriptional regulator n=1 Tax=Streptomyces orinoci TaxID=67339 RepID=A0ABV3JVH0_STRON|nr:helix-turn-helix transcriptional regulator [Streptomyces orinoci]